MSIILAPINQSLLCILYLLACQAIVTAVDSGLRLLCSCDDFRAKKINSCFVSVVVFVADVYSDVCDTTCCCVLSVNLLHMYTVFVLYVWHPHFPAFDLT